MNAVSYSMDWQSDHRQEPYDNRSVCASYMLAQEFLLKLLISIFITSNVGPSATADSNRHRAAPAVVSYWQ